jgi:hypothetical protein
MRDTLPRVFGYQIRRCHVLSFADRKFVRFELVSDCAEIGQRVALTHLSTYPKTVLFTVRASEDQLRRRSKTLAQFHQVFRPIPPVHGFEIVDKT